MKWRERLPEEVRSTKDVKIPETVRVEGDICKCFPVEGGAMQRLLTET